MNRHLLSMNDVTAEDVVRILDRMMAKKPTDRFQTPEELVHRLLQAAKALGVQAQSARTLAAAAWVFGDPRAQSLLDQAAALAGSHSPEIPCASARLTVSRSR